MLPVTVGDVVSDSAAVVKFQTKASAIGLPARSSAPVPMVTSYIVEYPRAASGLKVIVSPDQLNVPVTEGSVENAPSTDAVFIDSSNVTVITVVTGTSVPVGVLSVTVGGVLSCMSSVMLYIKPPASTSA